MKQTEQITRGLIINSDDITLMTSVTIFIIVFYNQLSDWFVLELLITVAS